MDRGSGTGVGSMTPGRYSPPARAGEPARAIPDSLGLHVDWAAAGAAVALAVSSVLEWLR